VRHSKKCLQCEQCDQLVIMADRTPYASVPAKSANCERLLLGGLSQSAVRSVKATD